MKIGKIAGISIVALVGFWFGVNCWTTVEDGTVKVESLFGEVKDEVYTAGFHFVNPLSDFDTFDTRNQKYEENGLTIPTNDRFNSTGNVTIIYTIDGAKAPWIKRNYGTADQYVDVALKQHLRAIVRDEGRKMKDSRSLAVSSNVSDMQLNTKSRLSEKVGGSGITIQDALIQEITFDPRITKQILATQQRIQKEEAEKSSLRIAATQADTAQAVAAGKANAAIEDARGVAESKLLRAQADKDSAILRAEGEAASIKLVADANLDLTKSLTAAILKKQQLDNEAILYSKSVGNVPQTVIGDTDLRALGVPMAVGSK